MAGSGAIHFALLAPGIEGIYISAMTITLPPALDRIVRDKVNAGLYASGTDLVCEALRCEFARDVVHEWVRVQAADGFAQLEAGEFEDLSREELMGRLSQRRAAGSCA
ncbi:MAG: hypothetical protein ABIZ56_09335 [Chthoniobacteraceae bacterium]